MAQAQSRIHRDNDQVRVTEWISTPDGATGRPRHGFDYVITQITDGEVGIAGPDGRSSSFHMAAGVSYCRAAGIEHDAVRRGGSAHRFVEVELKNRPG